MAGQVVIPFPTSRAACSHSDERGKWTAPRAGERRAWVSGRLGTALGVVRAVFETLSYLSEPRVRPPALPERGGVGD
jgi:hypothetical protein